MKKLVFTFGRMNPPTIGHEKLANKIKEVARKENANPRIYLSHTTTNTALQRKPSASLKDHNQSKSFRYYQKSKKKDSPTSSWLLDLIV